MKTKIENWKTECTEFENWFKALGGNISNQSQMNEAFRRIEAKEVSDNNLYRILEEYRAKEIEVTNFEVL